MNRLIRLCLFALPMLACSAFAHDGDAVQVGDWSTTSSLSQAIDTRQDCSGVAGGTRCPTAKAVVRSEARASFGPDIKPIFVPMAYAQCDVKAQKFQLWLNAGEVVPVADSDGEYAETITPWLTLTPADGLPQTARPHHKDWLWREVVRRPMATAIDLLSQPDDVSYETAEGTPRTLNFCGKTTALAALIEQCGHYSRSYTASQLAKSTRKCVDADAGGVWF